MSILIATPCYGGMASVQYMKSCIELRGELQKAQVEHDWYLLWNESLIQRARNTIAAKFLKTDFKKLLFIDADIEFEPEGVAKLWNLDADVAAGLYCMKRPDCALSAWRDGKLIERKDFPDEPFEVDYAGTGFFMIDRDVLLKMAATWDERHHEEGKIGKSFAWFNPRVEDGIYLSEDFAFCHDWRSLGGKIIADPSIKLVHHGTYGYAAT